MRHLGYTLTKIKKALLILPILAFLSNACSNDSNEKFEIKNRKAVIIILADDLGGHLECMGTPAIKTPATTALAQEGIIFTNAFSSCASCSPSRASILTGMYQHSNGLWRNVVSPAITSPFSEFRKEQEKKYVRVGVWEHIPSLIELLNSNDIFTGITNKYHVTPSWKFVFEGRIKLGNSPVDYAKEVDELLSMAGNRSFFLLVNVGSSHRPFQNHLKFAQDLQFLDIHL